MTGATVLLFIKSYYDHFNINYDIVSVNTTDPVLLVYDLYEAYHKQHRNNNTSTKVVTPDEKNGTHKELEKEQNNHNKKDFAPLKNVV